MKTIEDFVRPTQEQLFEMLREMFKTESVHFCKENYILVKGQAPIMLLAHLDTVHEEPVKQICETRNGRILMSPQGIGGDDRCGVYALATLWERSSVKPWLMFTCNEEIGCIGAAQFCTQHANGRLPKELNELKALIQIDRKGKDDAVYYNCGNKEFEAYITGKGFKTNIGSCSDISYVAPELGVAAVNLSSGYYNPHTLHEYIDRKQLNATIKKVLSIIEDSVKPDYPKYEYIAAPAAPMRSVYGYWGYGGLRGIGSGRALKNESLAEVRRTPANIQGPLNELVEYGFYTSAELIELYEKYGEEVIHALYEQEFGCPYTDEAEDDENLEDADEFAMESLK